MVVDRTLGLDRAHADPARNQRADNRMVWTLGQSDSGAQSAGRLLGGLAQPRRSRGRWPNRTAVRSARTSRVGSTAPRTAPTTLPPSTSAPGMDTQSRYDREAAAGHTSGARPDGGSGTQARTRTNIRERLRRTELRVSTRTRLRRSSPKRRTTLGRRPRLVRGRRFQELLRYDTARATARTDPAADSRWPSNGAAGTELEGGSVGRTEGLATDRAWHAAGGRHKSDTGQPVSQPAGPPNGPVRLANGALRRRLGGAVPDQRRSRAGVEASAPMEPRSGTDRASDQNAHRQRPERRLRLPGLALSRGQEMATKEEPSEIAGQTATAERTHQPAQPE